MYRRNEDTNECRHGSFDAPLSELSDPFVESHYTKLCAVLCFLSAHTSPIAQLLRRYLR